MMMEMLMMEYVVIGDEVVEMSCSGCADCPFHVQCEKEELWWGCSVWEESMGEDLQTQRPAKIEKSLKKVLTTPDICSIIQTQ